MTSSSTRCRVRSETCESAAIAEASPSCERTAPASCPVASRRASSEGSQGRSRPSTCTPRSREGTPTCTWIARPTASSDRTGVGARRYSVAMARRTPLGSMAAHRNVQRPGSMTL
jgi:hypothetical protein